MSPSFISFDNGVCRRLRRPVDERIDEAILACDAVQQEARLLGQDLQVLANVRREPGAMNGFVVIRAEN